MFSRKTLIFGGVVLTVGLTWWMIGCKPKPKPMPGRFYSGLLFGFPYEIDVVGDSTDYQRSIDSILHEFEIHFSLNNPESTLSRYNAYTRTDRAFSFVDTNGTFGIVYDIMRDLSLKTNKYYDPTTRPVQRAWQSLNMFGRDSEPNLDSLYEFVGFDGAKMDLIEGTGKDGYSYSKSYLRKTDPRLEADFTDVASSYALDQVGEFLNSKKVQQFRIKYENRVLTSGAYVDSLNVMSLGMMEAENDQKIRVFNRAYAFVALPQKRMMIDPTYGYPPDNELIFVGVSAPKLYQAVAFSQSFMIMGLTQSTTWYENEDNMNSDIQSFMLIKRGEEITSASTEAFDTYLIPADTTQVETE
jgi:FAD:protein FMN transferase